MVYFRTKRNIILARLVEILGKCRAHILEILCPETAPTTNNVAEITHSSWGSAGEENMTLAETCIFDLCHAFLIEAHIERMYNLSYFM